MPASSVERVTSLLALLLERRTPLTLRQVATELGEMYPSNAVALRGAFERDKALLREIGVPIETEVLGGDQAGETAYRIDRERYELRGLELDDDERRALQVAVAATRSAPAQQGVWKLGGASVGTSSVLAELPAFEALPTLRGAIAGRRSVQFEYRDTARRLDPYGLLLRRGFWYVIGFDHGHGEPRTYRVDRIAGDVDVVAGSSFDVPDDFRVDGAFPDDPKLLGAEESRAAVVAIHGPIAAIVRAELGDGALVGPADAEPVQFEVPCGNLAAFRSWVLGLGQHAEVLAPPDVRDHVVQWLTALVDLDDPSDG